MVIDPKNTYVAYRCPECGRGVVSSVGIFSLSSDMLKLKCECGGSEMTVVSTSDGKLRLTVPCLMCSAPHNFTVSRSIFFGKELFVIPCPYTDINIAFLGELDAVSSELSRSEMELLDLLGQENIDALGGSHGETGLPDPEILDIIMFVISDLAEENKISCRCNEGNYGVELTDDGVRVFCRSCGAEQTVVTDSLLGAHAFLNCDRLILE